MLSRLCGFVIWHSEFPDLSAWYDSSRVDGTVANTGGAVTEVVLHHNNALHEPDHVVAVVFCRAIVNAKMHPDAKDVVSIDPKLLEDAPEQ